jgi:hypothetical protein
VKRIAWTDQARADIRSLDKPTAMRILAALHRFAASRAGGLKMLQGGIEELRLRIGDRRFSLFTPAATPSRFAAFGIGVRRTVEP